jgi:ribosomal protein L37AE/L43A
MEVVSAAAAMPDFDLHNWFGREELEPCPACGDRAGIRLAANGSFLCLECGHVGAEPAHRPAKQEREDEAPQVD